MIPVRWLDAAISALVAKLFVSAGGARPLQAHAGCLIPARSHAGDASGSPRAEPHHCVPQAPLLVRL